MRILLIILALVILIAPVSASVTAPSSWGTGYKIYGKYWDAMGDTFAINGTTDKINGVINVGNYSTIQDALNQTSATITTIEIPCGTYNESIQISTNDLTLHGQGDCTIINGSNPISTTPQSTRYYRLSIENLKVNISDGNSIGIDYTNVSSSSVKDVTIRGSKAGSNEIGILVRGGAYYNDFYNVRMNTVQIGYLFDNISNENNIYGGSIIQPSTAISVNFSNNIHLYAVDMETCDIGIYTNYSNTNIINPRIESCTNAIVITSNATKTMVLNPYYASNSVNMADSSTSTTIFQGVYNNEENIKVSSSGAFAYTLMNLTRNNPGDAAHPMINLSDTYTSSGTPNILEMHKLRNAGVFEMFWNGATEVFNTTKAGNINLGSTSSCISFISPDGTRYTLTIANGGTTSVAPGTCL